MAISLVVSLFIALALIAQRSARDSREHQRTKTERMAGRGISWHVENDDDQKVLAAEIMARWQHFRQTG